MKEKITLFMETTKKSPEQTIGEIQILIKKIGIRDFLMQYGDDREINAVSFSILSNKQILPFRLPINHKPLWKHAQNGRTKYIKDEQQARRVAWRQLYRWIEAQMALIITEMVTVEEVFLPYLLLNKTESVYDKFITDGFAGQLTEGETKL